MRKPLLLLVAVIALVIYLPTTCFSQVVKPQKNARFGYADMMELIAVNDKCSIIRWGLTHNVYETTNSDKGDGGKTISDASKNVAKITIDSLISPIEGGQPISGTCDREKFDETSQYVFPITSGSQAVLVKLHAEKYRFNLYAIEYGGTYNIKYESKNIDPDLLDGTVEKAMSPLHCFEDLNLYYCLRERVDEKGRKRYFLHRFAVVAAKRSFSDDDNTKRGLISDIVRVGILELNIPHRGTPAYTFFDSFSGDLIIFYEKFDGHEAYLADVRNLYGLRTRGLLLQCPFKAENVLGVKSYYGHRWFVTKGTLDPSVNSSDTKTRITIYNTVVGHHAINPLKTFEAVYDEEFFGNIDNIGIFIQDFYLDPQNDRHALTQISSQLCASLNQVLVDCDAYANSLITYKLILFIVVGVLTFLFIILALLLMLYLLCCVKTKRRRRRKKRKHRKHRKHRKETETPTTGSKAPDEVDVDLDTKNAVQPTGKDDEKEDSDKEKEKEKKKEGGALQKLKKFAGVDYSSSSSEEGKVEHSQAYFSAREHFDNKNGTNTTGTKNTGTATGTVNVDSPYENLGPPPKSSTTDMNAEQDLQMQEKYVQQHGKPQGPRSVYMKPAKNKKKK